VLVAKNFQSGYSIIPTPSIKIAVALLKYHPCKYRITLFNLQPKLLTGDT